jgi:hypothetical protein
MGNVGVKIFQIQAEVGMVDAPESLEEWLGGLKVEKVSITIDSEILERLQKICQEQDRPLSWVINKILKERNFYHE